MKNETVVSRLLQLFVQFVALMLMLGFVLGAIAFIFAGNYFISVLCAFLVVATLAAFTRPKRVEGFSDHSLHLSSLYSKCIVHKEDLKWVYFGNEYGAFPFAQIHMIIKQKSSFFPLNIHVIPYQGNDDLYNSAFFDSWRDQGWTYR